LTTIAASGIINQKLFLNIRKTARKSAKRRIRGRERPKNAELTLILGSVLEESIAAMLKARITKQKITTDALTNNLTAFKPITDDLNVT
jgi:hypothetical protein